jgi:hypothetical protein
MVTLKALGGFGAPLAMNNLLSQVLPICESGGIDGKFIQVYRNGRERFNSPTLVLDPGSVSQPAAFEVRVALHLYIYPSGRLTL